MTRQNPIPGPDDIARRELDNGIVIWRERTTAQSLIAGCSGRRDSDSPEQAGWAAFTAEALLYGTQGRDFEAIHETLEGLGADLSFDSGVHHVGFGGKSLAEDLPTLLDLAQDALRCPTLPGEHIERLRGQIVTDLQIREHDTRYRASRAFRELAYAPGHPYHYSVGGTLETIPTLSQPMMVDFHRRHYGPRGMLVVVVGAVEKEKALDAVAAGRGGWQNPDQPVSPDLPPLKPMAAIRRQDEAVPGKTQSDIVLGWPGPSRRDPDFHAARLANSILGVRHDGPPGSPCARSRGWPTIPTASSKGKTARVPGA
jgi:zinc protease